MTRVLFLLFSCIIFNSYAQQFKEWKDVKLEDEGELGTLLKKAGTTKFIDSSYYYFTKAIKNYEKRKDKSLYPYLYYNLGNSLYRLNKIDSAKYYFHKAIKLYPKNAKSDLLSYHYSYLGVIAYHNEDYDLAAFYYNETINAAEDEIAKIRIKTNLAQLYIEKGENYLGKEFLDDVFEYYKKNTTEGLDHPDLIYNYSSLAKIEKELDKQIVAVNKMLAIIAKTNYPNAIVKAKTTIEALSLKGDIYLHATPKRYLNAIHNFEKCITLAKKHNLEEALNRNYILLAMAYNFKKEYRKSIQYIDSIQNNKEKWMVGRIDNLKFEGYYQVKKFDSLFYYANKIINAKDSIINNLETNGYIQYGKKYQTEKKIQENELLKKEGIIKDLKAKRDNQIRYLLIAIIGLSILLIRIIFRRNKKNKKIAKVLANKNETISSQNKELTQANETKQRIFSIIAHDLINPFNTVLGFSKLLYEDFENLNEEDKKEYAKIINTSSETNYKLTKSLLDWARLQQNKFVVVKTTFKIKQLILESISSLELASKKKDIEVFIDIKAHITLLSDENILRTVVHNLVSNAIKFTPENGKVTITASLINKDCQLKIIDSGIGISKEQLERIRERNHISTKGTNNEMGNGFGLLLSDELIELLAGTLTVESELNKGTTVTIHLPNAVA